MIDIITEAAQAAASHAPDAGEDAARIDLCESLGVFPKKTSPDMSGKDWVFFVPGNGASKRYMNPREAIDKARQAPPVAREG